ncbi:MULTISPECIES: CapA family protein [unclassified Pseudoalteromonas]|uniref:CapA family protein n=1 Tax=unclassified Pseudoalteromonas TaxID=194690 RepID=UPI00235907CC|nr:MULTISPECIES: CapA family protein [unclassified Pseudoalteromonas]MDC9499812.1 CapA family protein [Pseudoalteromonas sp. Angola-20]MDC9518589.1 CapA family protein [Pseudoalteromonas sp. Angola-22]MDC9534996.1 CapA family protein [Pseudoalteromonas sp. Angola-9]
MKILITGDLVINKNYNPTENIDKKLIDLFSNSDFNVTNLEAPVTNVTKKIVKSGPHLKSHKTSTLNVLKKLNINIATLANNHIKDYGEEGVTDTIDFCKSNGIDTLGAGVDLAEASNYLVLNTKEGKIALINIAENEWASADETKSGANGMNLIKDIKSIQKAKAENDFVFVIVHGGHEYYNLPSPRIQEQYRFYAEQGADLVVGHHTHTISGHEIYNDTPIYYSLGNFLFTEGSNYEGWYTGLVLEININSGIIVDTLHPVQLSKDDFSLSLSDGQDKLDIIEQESDYSNIIICKNRLLDCWLSFIDSRRKSYLNYWSPKIFIRNRYLRTLLKWFSFTNSYGLSYYLNLMSCESHHDLSKAIIKEKLKK